MYAVAHVTPTSPERSARPFVSDARTRVRAETTTSHADANAIARTQPSGSETAQNTPPAHDSFGPSGMVANALSRT